MTTNRSIIGGNKVTVQNSPGATVVGGDSFGATRAPRRALQGSIFISYRREDSSDVTGRIYDRLVGEFGPAAVFKDAYSLPLGRDFAGHIHDCLSRCVGLIAVIGRRWAVSEVGLRRLDDPSDWVRVEVELALERDILVVPALVQGQAMPTVAELPEKMRPLVGRQGLPIRPDPDFDNDVRRLMSAFT